MRSCYRTQARFYNGDATEDTLEWYFVPDNTPFLPVPSVINSLNWVDAKERTDTPAFAGEVGTASRNYVKGNRDVSLLAQGYCGTPTDWLGNGTRPSSVSVDINGNPQCCGGPTDGFAVADAQALFTSFSSNIPLTSGPTGVPAVRSSTWSFGNGNADQNNWFGVGLQLDLYSANPNGSGTNDFISDFAVCDFPGYASVPFSPFILLPDPTFGPGGQSMPVNASWQQVGPISGTNHKIEGIVISDNTGIVYAYYTLYPPIGPPQPQFALNGDFYSVNLTWGWVADYP